MTVQTSIEGGCSCGHVRFRMNREPLFVHCCHCSWCQRETGSAFALNAIIEADRVELLAGEVEVVDTPSNSGKGQRIMGIGESSGEHRAVEAAQQAIASPLLEETSIAGARGLLINITGGEELTLNEVNEAAEIITEGTDPQARILFGAVISPEMGEGLQVTVIATGFQAAQEGVQLPAQEPVVAAAAIDEAEAQGQPLSQVRRRYKEQGMLEVLRAQLLEARVVEFLVAEATLSGV